MLHPYQVRAIEASKAERWQFGSCYRPPVDVTNRSARRAGPIRVIQYTDLRDIDAKIAEMIANKQVLAGEMIYLKPVRRPVSLLRWFLFWFTLIYALMG